MIKMARVSKSVLQDPEVIKAIENAKKNASVNKITEAKQVLAEYEGEYEHAKEVFFKVNGARRIIKNGGKEEATE